MKFNTYSLERDELFQAEHCLRNIMRDRLEISAGETKLTTQIVNDTRTEIMIKRTEAGYRQKLLITLMKLFQRQ